MTCDQCPICRQKADFANKEEGLNYILDSVLHFVEKIKQQKLLIKQLEQRNLDLRVRERIRNIEIRAQLLN